jgi:hypothetical protein
MPKMRPIAALADLVELAVQQPWIDLPLRFRLARLTDISPKMRSDGGEVGRQTIRRDDRHAPLRQPALQPMHEPHGIISLASADVYRRDKSGSSVD